MCHYTHFTKGERELSRFLKPRLLNRSPSSVSREFLRNSYANGTFTQLITQISST